MSDAGEAQAPAPRQPEPAGVVRSCARVLSFRATHEQLRALGPRELAFGLAVTWVAGVGRYWDHPDASLVQHLGLGSLVYVFALASFLWLLIWPLGPQGWRFTRVLTFVTLTSPPALLYAIPVERFMTLAGAQAANFWFLAIVALWRVALLLWFLRRLARLRGWLAVVATLLPLALIVVSLAALNLEQAVFEFMSGMRQPGTANDEAYAVVVALAVLSVFSWPVLVLAYLAAIAMRLSARAKAKAGASPPRT